MLAEYSARITYPARWSSADSKRATAIVQDATDMRKVNNSYYVDADIDENLVNDLRSLRLVCLGVIMSKLFLLLAVLMLAALVFFVPALAVPAASL